MSLWTLPKDCLYELMMFLPNPVDKKNLVLAVGSYDAEQAFTEPSLWKDWKNLNVTDAIFLRDPEAITWVLDYVPKIEKVMLKLEKEKNDVCINDIVECVGASRKTVWNAKELEIDLQTVGLTQEYMVKLVELVLSRLGDGITDVKFHVNERPRQVYDSTVYALFRSILYTGKFRNTTSFDLCTGGRRVGEDFYEVLNAMNVKRLKIASVNYLTPNCLNGIILNLEEFTMYHCSGISIEGLVGAAPPLGPRFGLMKKIIIKCKSSLEAVKWNVLCHLCADHCSFEITVTEPMTDGDNEFEEQEYYTHIKNVVRYFITTEFDSQRSVDIKHTLIIGQLSTIHGLYPYHMNALTTWMELFELETEKMGNRVKYEVKSNSIIQLVCD